MIHAFTYTFAELNIDRNEIERILGYPEDLPEPFRQYLDEAWYDAGYLKDIRGCYGIFDEIIINLETSDLTAGNKKFDTGKLINHELKNSEEVAFFIATAGEAISAKSEELMHAGDAMQGYIYDVLGSFIAEGASEKIHHKIKTEATKRGMCVTNRYSPGYCNWQTNDQHKLFSLFKGNTCGVALTDSALMKPVKSVSGIIGVGHKVRFRTYQCDICKMKQCNYRKILSKNSVRSSL